MPIQLLFKPTRPPRKHQWDAMEKAKGKKSFGYFLEMGCGKSKVAIDELIQLVLEGTVNQAIIFAGAGSYGDWLSKHLPENVPENVGVLAHLWEGGHSQVEKHRLQIFTNSTPVLRVLIMNIESLGASKTGQLVARNFVRGGKTAVIVDESTKIKNISANCTVEAIRLGKDAVIKRILTGSAVTKSPMDLWGQISFLGIEEMFASNWYGFRARFCKMTDVKIGMQKRKPEETGPSKDRKVKKIIGYQNLDKLERLLNEHSFRALKADCLDIPPKSYQRYLVELTKEQEKLYFQMTKVAMAEIREGIWSSAKNAMGRLEKLHQIILGHLVDEDGTVHGIETNRPSVLCDLIEEAGDKIIVWCRYRRDVTLVLEELGKRFPDRVAVRYDGNVPKELRPDAVQSFQSGNASFFVGTAATGGFGLTLTASANTIYYSNNFNLEHRIQSEDRNHRDGQTKAVTYVDMMCAKTVEEHIIKLLRQKKEMSDMVMGDGVREWLNWMQ